MISFSFQYKFFFFFFYVFDPKREERKTHRNWVLCFFGIFGFWFLKSGTES